MIEELNGDFLQWLRGFYHVARTGSVRKAAELMRRNPSTISYQLRSLEEELGTVLFDRYKKTLRITPEGKKLLGWTISTFETLQSMRSSVGNASGELQGRIRMAATLPIVTMAAQNISDFTKKHPRVDLEIERGLSLDVRKAVADSEVDFGLLAVIKKPEMDHMEVFFKARPLLVMHRDNPWDVPARPEPGDLERLPYVSFIARGEADELGTHMLSVGMGSFMDKNAVIKINNYHLIMRFVWQKLGVAIMDEVCFQGTHFGADWEKLVAIPLEHLLPCRLYGLLTRRHKHISPQALALIASLREFFSAIKSLDRAGVWQSIRQLDRPNA